MSTKIFVNLPVKDLTASKEFFAKLGYSFDPMFSDEKAACLVISDDIYVMLLVEPFFKTFTEKEVADATKTTEVLVALSADSRQEVDRLFETALAAGATPANETLEEGPMYSRSFNDLDGHIWEIGYMDMAALKEQAGSGS